MRQIYIPQNQKLKDFVRYISFYVSDEGQRNFLVFPNPGAAIGLHKEHGFLRKEQNVFEGIQQSRSTQLLHVNRIDPVQVIDEGVRESITIVFRPMGVNYFIRDDLDALIIKNEHT